MDTTINGTISYDPPVIYVQEDNLLNVNIGRGLISAKCLPNNNPKADPATLFKAEFTNLAGSGKIRLGTVSYKMLIITILGHIISILMNLMFFTKNV